MKRKSKADEFMTVAWEAAESAGTLVRQSWHQKKDIHYKSAVDLLTSVDRQSERRIVEVLHQHFPEHSILAEEETHIDGAHPDHRWIIDPLDGTTNLAHGYPQVSISIALEHEGEIIRGLVYDPLRRECFAAAKGQGASLNGSPIKTSQTREVDKSLLATGFPYDRRENADFYLAFFRAFLIASQGIRRAGSAALDLCYVACGRLDGFWELKLHAWDTAAGSLIVREAGGTITGLSGKQFSIWEMETLASNGFIQDALVRIATQVANEHRTLTPLESNVKNLQRP